MGRYWLHHLSGRDSNWVGGSQQLNCERSHNKGAQKASGDGDGMTA